MRLRGCEAWQVLETDLILTITQYFMNQRYVAQLTRMAAPVNASKQHRDTFLIHPLVQSGMRTRREKMMRRHFSR